MPPSDRTEQDRAGLYLPVGRRTHAMPVVARPVSDRRLAKGRLPIMLTVTAWTRYFVWWLLKDQLNQQYSGTVDRAESIMYLLIVTVQTASSLAYLLSRLSFDAAYREGAGTAPRGPGAARRDRAVAGSQLRLGRKGGPSHLHLMGPGRYAV